MIYERQKAISLGHQPQEGLKTNVMTKANLESENEPTYFDKKARIINCLQDHPGTIKACNKNHVSPYMMTTNWLTGYCLDNGKESVEDLWAYIVYCYDEFKETDGRSAGSQARFIMFEDICVEGWPSQTKGFYKRWKTFLKTGDWYHDIKNNK